MWPFKNHLKMVRPFKIHSKTIQIHSSSFQNTFQILDKPFEITSNTFETLQSPTQILWNPFEIVSKSIRIHLNIHSKPFQIHEGEWTWTCPQPLVRVPCQARVPTPPTSLKGPEGEGPKGT